MNLNMDINILRSLVTAFGFVLFIGILVWAYRPARKAAFDEAAQLPFDHMTNKDGEPQP
jgi:cytochrome c oxidase cbb3-type subunit IV